MTRLIAQIFMAFISSLPMIPDAKSLCREKSVSTSLTTLYQKPAELMENPTKLVSPASFPQLPKNIVRNLQSRRCKIPQIIYPWPDRYWKPGRHNVIRGRFATPDQYDWAVFCLRNGTSSIFIYWGGSTTSVAEIEKQPDVVWSHFKDGVGDYGRAIFRADKKTILRYDKEYHQPDIDPLLPPIDHDGIMDAYLEKASTIHYYYRRKWLMLHGAD